MTWLLSLEKHNNVRHVHAVIGLLLAANAAVFLWMLRLPRECWVGCNERCELHRSSDAGAIHCDHRACCSACCRHLCRGWFASSGGERTFGPGGARPWPSY